MDQLLPDSKLRLRLLLAPPAQTLGFFYYWLLDPE
jgi:hypothetical protein